MAGGAGRRGNREVEHRDDVPVEIHAQRRGAGELTQDILLVQTGDAAGFEDFLVHGGLQRMVTVQDRLGEQHRNIAVESRGILRIGDEFAPLAEDGLADKIVHVGERQFGLAVDAGLPGVAFFRIVPEAVSLEVVQDGKQPDILLLAACHPVREQREVHFAVRSADDRVRLGMIAVQDGRQLMPGLFALDLEGVVAGGVRVGAGHGALEKDRRIGDPRAGLGIRHLSPDPGRLGVEPDRGQESETNQYETDSGHNPSNLRIFWQCSNNINCTGGRGARVWPSRAGCGRGIRRRRSQSGESRGRPYASFSVACRWPFR